MKIRRYKKVHKHMGFYVNNFGFRQPYQLLVDGTFCYAALNNKINIADNIPRYLQGEIKLLTTPCAVIEMESLGPKLKGALLILKNFAAHKCGHKENPVPGSDCLLSMLGETNESHYVLATQDRDLQNKVRKVPGVPLLYLHIKTPVLEHPSDVTVELAKKKMSGVWQTQKKALEELKLKSSLIRDEDKPRKRGKRVQIPCHAREVRGNSVVRGLQEIKEGDRDRKKEKEKDTDPRSC